MSKGVAFKMPVKAKAEAAAEQWVGAPSSAPAAQPEQARTAPAPKPAVMKRLTIDVSEDLHRRVKVGAAQRGMQIADILREMLEREFPAS